MNDQGLLHNFMLFEYEDVKPSKSSDGIVTMTGIIQKAGQPNANNRIYPRQILEREDKRYKELIQDRRALGELAVSYTHLRAHETKAKREMQQSR